MTAQDQSDECQPDSLQESGDDDAQTHTQARYMWQLVAGGQVDGGVLQWLQRVAARILEADDDPKKLGASQRVYEITRAVGLAGKRDKHAELRALVQALDGFLPVDEKDGTEQPFRRGEEMKLLIELARKRGLVSDEASDPEVRKLIERLLNSPRKL